MKLWPAAMKLLTLAILSSIATSNTSGPLEIPSFKHGASSAVKVSGKHGEDKETLIQQLSQKLNSQKKSVENIEDTEAQRDVSDAEELSTIMDDKYKVPKGHKQAAETMDASTWFELNKNKIFNGLLIIVGFVLFVLIAYKYYSINMSIKEQHAQIQNYADQLETIIEGADRLVFATWKDQKENIKFVDNPAYKKKAEGEMSKTQQIEAEILKVQKDIEKKTKDIDNLREKEEYYNKEINQLEVELAEARTLVLDEGAALGFADTVLREFK